MNILFYGGYGWIGGMIISKWKELYPQHNIILSNTRICPKNTPKIVKEIMSADRVFSTIGRTSGGGIPNIDYLEDHLDENVRDNLYSPMMLAQICSMYGKHLSYIGTGCIFSTDTRDNKMEYYEDDVPDYFGSAYSVVKGYTDSLMKLYTDNVLNLRIRMPVTDDWSAKNFITKLVKFEKICSYPNSMTYLPDLIPIMIHMSINSTTGTFNMVNGHISHEEILEKYKKIVDKKHKFKLIEEDELYTMLKSKRSNNILSNKHLKAYCFDNGLTFKKMDASIEDALLNMKNNK